MKVSSLAVGNEIDGVRESPPSPPFAKGGVAYRHARAFPPLQKGGQGGFHTGWHFHPG
jgi:hypothetical protein